METTWCCFVFQDEEILDVFEFIVTELPQVLLEFFFFFFQLVIRVVFHQQSVSTSCTGVIISLLLLTEFPLKVFQFSFWLLLGALRRIGHSYATPDVLRNVVLYQALGVFVVPSVSVVDEVLHVLFKFSHLLSCQSNWLYLQCVSEVFAGSKETILLN